jgi:cell division protein FtsB
LRLNLLAVMLLAGVVFLQYRLWLEPGGVLEAFTFKKKLALQISENEKLKNRNDDLMLQIQHLQNNEAAIESRARSELGMIKGNETYYQIIK